ncbi:hypothetical protein RJ639_041478 [Escallonia herrerae]|uniref:DYW domain-containing protein n=1 Tax=Escallonia herrerae TaxID=1293975 RepID=A0AA88WKD7_9ASTE|nr:hypothetical protein RJ639_041478 [Escallonia herrerae]
MSQLKEIHAQTLRSTSTQHPHTLFLHTRILHFSSSHDLDYAFRLFTQIEYPNSFVWNTLIQACALYAAANRWNEVGLLRKMMTDKGVRKEPGCSSIEIDGVDHEFFAGDTSHSQTKDIYQLLDVIEDRLGSIGYCPDVSQAPMVDETIDGKQQSLRLHSERLAIAFGLLNLKPGVPIRVLKNLRVCDDCHNVTKLISKMYNVDIIVRDRARFHHFRDGSCSCMDYW